MKHTLCILVLSVLCVNGNCKLDSEVFGTYQLETQNQSHQFGSVPVKRIENAKQTNDESTTAAPTLTATQSNQLAAFNNFNYNAAMARKIGLSTLMMSGVLYGISMLPALIAITGAGPLSGMNGLCVMFCIKQITLRPLWLSWKKKEISCE